ncbi:LysR family transcriptional regulator [Variovorax sp. HJSM1_2]|uniref:LysR family transcriptional regulator n=1 Tax=Variovorax sp. HJSM1_2 TaxID=3366263 RepID=UPI003BBD5A5B
MNLRQIEVFRAVMMAGSVTDAARLLHVSQPGISRMLAHIELQLGVQLFDRVKGKLRPRSEAQFLYDTVEQVYRGVQRIDDAAQALKHGGGQTLRVLASPSLSLEAVPQAVAEVAQKFPQVRLYVEALLVRDMVAQLARGEADVALSTLPIEHALLQAQAIGEWSLACVFQAGHALQAKRSISARDVLHEPIIGFSADTPQGRLIDTWRQEHGLGGDARIEVRSGQLASSLAASGAGIAIVDNLTARAWTSEKLAFRPIQRAPTFKIYAAYNSNSAGSPVRNALIEKVRLALKRA